MGHLCTNKFLLINMTYVLFVCNNFEFLNPWMHYRSSQRPSLVQLNRFLKIFLMPIQSKAFSGPVKSIPKDFFDTDPVEVVPRPCLIQLNRFLKIFLMPIQSKLIQDLPWFSQIATKISLIRIPVEVIPRPCLVQLNRFLKIFLMPIQLKLFQDLVWSS